MRISDAADLWWKSAVIYCVDVETFMDSDDDGVGDFAGLAQRIDYLSDLGVTCLWLMPFYPSPNRDDGYDITDFYGVDPRLGSLGDLVEVIRACHHRGIRVIADLVVNHTSTEHPWFKESRSSVDNRFRDYYVWRADPPPDTSDAVVFHEEEDSIWNHDPITGHWYLHRFYAHQPDLNMANPKVRDEIAKIIGFWLELGFDGFRVDAVPQLLTVGIHDTIENERGFTDPHGFLRELRTFMGRRRGHSVLLGEVDLMYRHQLELFGGSDGGELDMIFDFPLMQSCYLAMAREDAGPVAGVLKNRPEVPAAVQWATFLRNHDELALDLLTEAERAEVFAAFGPQKKFQVYNRGLKRRLAPMLDGDPARLRLAYSLLFSLPGTPSLYYGEEIGMGEDASLGYRMAVRTPMQWGSASNGGFSARPGSELARPPVKGSFGPRHVNVSAAKRDPASLFNFIRELIRVYREYPEMAWGRFELLEQPVPNVLAHRCSWDGASTIAVHNFAAKPATVTLKLGAEHEGATVRDLLGGPGRDIGDGGALRLRLGPYGFRWLRLASDGGQDVVPEVQTTYSAKEAEARNTSGKKDK